MATSEAPVGTAASGFEGFQGEMPLRPDDMPTTVRPFADSASGLRLARSLVTIVAATYVERSVQPCNSMHSFGLLVHQRPHMYRQPQRSE